MEQETENRLLALYPPPLWFADPKELQKPKLEIVQETIIMARRQRLQAMQKSSQKKNGPLQKHRKAGFGDNQAELSRKTTPLLSLPRINKLSVIKSQWQDHFENIRVSILLWKCCKDDK